MNTRLLSLAKRAVAASLATAAGLGLTALVIGSAQASAMTNIPVATPYASHCALAPTSTQCYADAIATLNHGRAALGQPAYKLPRNLASHSAADQLIILVNADRAMYHLPQADGLNTALNQVAARAVPSASDPVGIWNVNGASAHGYGSNMAMGWKNPLYDYYFWMYADGPGGYNMDCPTPSSSGCWGHRNVILMNFGAGNRVLMGVGGGLNNAYHNQTYTMILEGMNGAAGSVPTIPTVTSITPATGSANGGTRVQINGFGFGGLHYATFAGHGGHLAGWTHTAIAEVVPPGHAGAAAVTVNTTGGNSANNQDSTFTYQAAAPAKAKPAVPAAAPKQLVHAPIVAHLAPVPHWH